MRTINQKILSNQDEDLGNKRNENSAEKSELISKKPISRSGPRDEDDDDEDDDDELIPVERNDEGDGEDVDVEDMNGEGEETPKEILSDLGAGVSKRDHHRKTHRMIDHEPGVSEI